MQRLSKTGALLLACILAGLPVQDCFAQHEHGAQEREARPYWSCPMHPEVTSDKPGRCPICGMNLEKQRYIPKPEKDSGEAMTPEPEASLGKHPAAGRVPFALLPAVQQELGVTKGRVERRHLTETIRAAGRVAFDPETYSAVEDYRIALKTAQAQPLGAEQSRALLEGARTRLRLAGLSEEQIRSINREPGAALSFLLPSGKVWVYADIYEYESARVAPGQRISAVSPSLEGRVFEGRISSINPAVDPATRTLRIRAEMDNKEDLLKPGMLLDTTIEIDHGMQLAVPEDAVVHTGREALVYLAGSRGEFHPVVVSLGRKRGAFYPVIQGLKEGDELVTSANFLLDSEARIRGVRRGRGGEAVPGHEGH